MLDSRRNILRKMIAAVATAFAKPIKALPAAKKLTTVGKLKGATINIGYFKKNDWFNIFSTLTNSDNAEKLAQKAEQQLRFIKIDDNLAKAIVNYTSRNGDTFADYVQESLVENFPSNLNMDPDEVDQFIGQPFEKALEFLKDPKYYSAGDIYYNTAAGKPRVLYSAEQMIDKGMFRGDNEIVNTIDSVIKDAIKIVKSEMSQKKKANAYASSIEYSPADYLGGSPDGGSQQHGYKLAVDHYHNDTKNLIALYEKVQQYH